MSHISSRDGFLKPETRCDYYIDERMKRIWQTLLDMLELVSRVCQENDLRFWMSGGSLLGTIRHQGIIPWDDDIDIELPRKDYDALMKILPEKLPSHLRLVNFTDTFEYVVWHAKVVDLRTTGIIDKYAQIHRKHPMGLFLDIFPVDGIPDDEVERARVAKGIDRIIRHRWAWQLNGSERGFLRRTRWFVRHHLLNVLGPERTARWMEDLLRRHDMNSCEWCHLAPGVWNFTVSKLSRKSEWYDETIMVPFEYLDVPVPKRHEEILRQQFGDWHQFVKGVSYHEGVIMDPDVPYADYLKSKYGYSERELELCRA